MAQRNSLIGALQIIAAGACFGFLGLFGKQAYLYEMTPGELLGMRFSIASLIMFSYFLIFSRKTFVLDLKTTLWSLALGGFGYAFFSSLYFMALQGVSASLTVLLLYIYPIFVFIISVLFLKEKLQGRSLLALALSLIGLMGLVWGEWSISDHKYILYGLSAAFFYALYVVISGIVLKNKNSVSTSFYTQVGAGLVLWLIHFQDIQRPITLMQNHSLFLIAMAFICSVLAMTLFLLGLQKVRSSEASLLSLSEPFFGVLVAAIFLNESLQWVQILGGALVISGLVLILKSKKNPTNS